MIIAVPSLSAFTSVVWLLWNQRTHNGQSLDLTLSQMNTIRSLTFRFLNSCSSFILHPDVTFSTRAWPLSIMPSLWNSLFILVYPASLWPLPDVITSEERQYTCNVTLGRVREAKATCITYSECVSAALFIQHAKRMRHILLSYVSCLTLLCFSTLSHKRQDFRGKELYALYSSPNINRVMKSRRLKWAGHVARIGARFW